MGGQIPAYVVNGMSHQLWVFKQKVEFVILFFYLWLSAPAILSILIHI